MSQAISPSWNSAHAASQRSPQVGARLLVVVCMVLLSPAWALAGNPSDEGCNQDPTCRELFLQGKDFYGQKDYASALRAFTSAYERRKTPILLINIGRSLQKLGRPEEALEYYQRCQDAAQSDTELQQRLSVYIAETKALMGQTPPRPAPTPAPVEVEPAPAPMIETSAVETKPIYKKGWFWGVVIGGVVVAGGAAALGTYFATRPAPDPMLPPDVVGIRPMF